ncbi:hypothetical protein [Rheinheimera sp. WS51]|uniref:hypothetical protein n=1 Tax=Rheinheimera sp. WS51 TaxID=3425886 RepID=UPI003D8B54BC
MKINKNIVLTSFAVGLLSLAGAANAGLVLDTGSITMGVQDNGGLGFSGVGIALTGGPGDAIMPGCLCEGWGAASDGVGSYTYGNSSSGFASSNFTTTGPADAVSTVVLNSGLTIVHTYSSAAGGSLFGVNVSIFNTSGADVADVRYARTLDWDVGPGHFGDDFTTIYGGTASGPGGNVLHTSFNPFAAPNPMSLRGSYGGVAANTNGTNVTGDLGAYFILGFGNLLAGESVSFDTYIGAAFSTSSLLSAFGSVGIEAYSYTYDDDGDATYGWGFANVGLPPAIDPDPTGIPAPASIALFSLGLAGLGFRLGRKNKQKV